MYDKDLKHRAVELIDDFNFDDSKSDCTKSILTQQAAKLL
jgi:hypothetical protein